MRIKDRINQTRFYLGSIRRIW